MDAAFHFFFVMFFLFAARVHIKHHSLAPLFFAFVTMFPDIDHFFGLQSRVTFHNVFFTVLFPLALVAIAFLFEKKGVFWKQFAIILLVVLAIHPVLDLPTENHLYQVKYFWPVSQKGFSLDSSDFAPYFSIAQEHFLISPLSVSIALALLLMLPVWFLEETVDFMARKKENAEEAAEDTLREFEDGLKEP